MSTLGVSFRRSGRPSWHTRLPRAYPVAKRVLDVVVSAPLLAMASPLVLLLALAIRRHSPGPALYTQVREGLHRRPFGIWKLRTMRTDADRVLSARLRQSMTDALDWERRFYLDDDPRIAGPVARLARRYGLDELPQLWNVLRGEMSLVGPRPIERYVAEALFAPDEWEERSEAPPGMTGLWQVRRPTASVSTTRRYDLLYVRRRSFALDLWVLLQTPRAMLRGRGA